MLQIRRLRDGFVGFYFFFLQDVRLVNEHRHGHTNEYTRHNAGLLYETNTATELGGSTITPQGTLGASDVTTMAPPFSPLTSGHFLRRNFHLPMGIVHALNLLNAQYQARKQHIPF